MKRPSPLYLAALVILLTAFVASAAWEFVLARDIHALLGAEVPAWSSQGMAWLHVMITAAAATLACAVCAPILLRLFRTHDRAERDRAERERAASEALLKRASRIARLGYFVWDYRRDCYAVCSEELALLFGYTAAEFRSRFDASDARVENIHPEDRAKVEAAYRRVRETKHPYDVEYRARIAGGAYCHFREQGRPVLDANDQVVEAVGFVQDMTERKQAEADLRKAYDLFEQTESMARLGHWEWDETADRATYCSRELARLHGVSVEEYLRFTNSHDADLQWVHPDDRERVRRIATQAKKEERGFEVEYRLQRMDGTALDVREVAVAAFDEEGRFVRSIGFVQDIQERKRTEEALRRARDELELRVEAKTRDLRKANQRLKREVAERRQIEEALRESKRTLQDRVAELEDAQRQLEKQSTDLAALASDLRIARDHAEQANQAKSRFLATMSHELRTPLNAIMGFSEIMASETFGPMGHEKYQDYVDDIYASGQHLLSLINDVLDLSKIESGTAQLHEEVIEITKLVESTLCLVNRRAEEREIDLTLELAEEGLSLLADRRKLMQILVNLLTNAIKFTPAEGKVTLRAWSSGTGGFVFQVIDTGIGIASEDIPKALSQFCQLDSDLNRQFEGTGLGLPLTKALVELHGGSLDLQSQVGVGTVITVRLPAARIVASESAAALEDAESLTAG